MARTKALPNRAELIIETAIRLFSHYGYERTSIEDIARELGIGKGSVYLDFKTKEEILMRIIESYATHIQELMDARIEHLQGSALECLSEMFETCAVTVYDYVTRDIHTPEALLHTSLQFKPRFVPFYVKKRERVLKLLKLAAANGEIDKDRANEETAVAFLMAISSLFPPYFNNYTESEARITRDELQTKAKIIISLVVEGLRAKH